MLLNVLNCSEITKEKYRVDVKYLEDGERFYPDGKGGQLGDLGTVENSKVLISEENSLVIDSKLEPGVYSYTLDAKRRRDAQQNHSGEHLFSALAYLNYGWRTVGFKMSESYCTLDFDRNDMSYSNIKELEALVNKKIAEEHQLKEEICDIEQANILMGERKDVATKIQGDIRMVSTFPEDFNACAGLHVENTKDIVMFKILSWEKIKSTCMRFYFISGDRCFKDYSKKHETISKLGQIFSCKKDDILTMVEKQLEEKKNLEKKLRALSLKYSETLLENILKNQSKEFNDKKMFFLEEEKIICDNIKKLFLERKLENKIFIGIDENNIILSSFNLDMQDLFKSLKEQIPLKGGGSKNSVVIKYEENQKQQILDLIFSNKLL